jgi:cell wall-associated NlpC family hydrolase
MTLSSRARVRRAAVIAAAATIGLGVLPLTAGTASAQTPKSSSESVAARADAALFAWQAFQYTDDPTHYRTFIAARDDTAELVAAELGIDATALRTAWARTDRQKQTAVLAALSQLGVPYRSMASIEDVGFDCSGLTTFAFAQAGVQLPRSSGTQVDAATRVDRATAEAGDLVYYPGHISMYLGIADAIVHSPNSGNHVEITFVQPRRVDSVVYADPLT